MTEKLEEEFLRERLEKVQKILDDKEVVNFFQTALHEGRHMTAMKLADGSLYFKQTSFHVLEHKPTELLLSPETFTFILETFLHAEKEFGVERKKHLLKLTQGTGKIKYKKTLSGL